MKKFIPKLIFVGILILGISSFVVIERTNGDSEQEKVGNTRFNSEMDNGFEERI